MYPEADRQMSYNDVQEKLNSIANALELRLSCTNPLISGWITALHLHVYLSDNTRLYV